ncbi:MAG: SufS family cysteine desulfurase [Lachnospiraceae bacterium]|nr:SufS family cysteine desulfurase [Lachnospiraceae bacterium]
MTAEDKRILEDFTLLKNDKTIYLDSAATSQKPDSVLKAVEEYYKKNNANPLRGLYDLSVRATDDYENARKKVAGFLGAKSAENIIFTRNATESLNLIAYSYAIGTLKPGDEIVISIMEHHSNLLPWQMAARTTGATLKFVECNENGILTAEDLKNALTENTKIVAITQVSNVFGCENNIKEFAALAHEAGAVFVCDGAQSVPHIPVNVTDLDVDFLAFSGHKMYAPMGIGALYAKYELLEKMQPFMYGGEMIEYVTRESATYAEIPHKFEAGTVNVGGAVGLSAAIDYINKIGFDTIEKRENELSTLGINLLKEIPHVHILGDTNPLNHHGIITFTVDDVHPHDIAAILDSDNVAIRAGHHCAQPLLKYMGVMSTARASFALYNKEDDVRAFAESVSKLRSRMGY